MQSNEILSVTYTAKPRDHRCRYWCKVIRSTTSLPSPELVEGANDVPGGYLRTGDDIELEPGDFVLEGEANHHRKQRGWTYNFGYLDESGTLRWLDERETKAKIKDAVKAGMLAAEVARIWLRGSGSVAALIRTALFVRGAQNAWADRIAAALPVG